MERRWLECTRHEKLGRWAELYGAMNPKGDIRISRFTHEAMEGPERYILLFDTLNNTIGLKPARPSTPNAFPAGRRGMHGGRVIRARRLCSEFGITLPQNVRFENPKIDEEGILLLDLRNARPAPRAPGALLDARACCAR